MKKSDEDLHRIASDYASTFDDVSWDCEEDFCAGFRTCEKDLLQEITKLKEALCEAVSHLGCGCGFAYKCPSCIFKAKQAAIIEEVRK